MPNLSLHRCLLPANFFSLEMTRSSILTELDEEPEPSRHKAKSSIAGTGLLMLIENSIRRLILPELEEIKQEDLEGFKQSIRTLRLLT